MRLLYQTPWGSVWIDPDEVAMVSEVHHLSLGASNEWPLLKSGDYDVRDVFFKGLNFSVAVCADDPNIRELLGSSR